MSVAAIERAVKRAVDLRGTVMLAAADNEDQWCAICAAVDGSLELRVGEPGGGWRHRGRRRSGEAWLRDHGFVHVVDAWAKPVGISYSARASSETLDHALREGLGVRADAELVEVLVHPGLIGDVDPPALEASHAAHIGFALRALAHVGRGKLSIEGGQPAETWAWAFVRDGEMILSPETPRDDDEWTVSLAESDVARAADELTALLHNQLNRDPRAPLFLSCMPLKPSERWPT
ncbi:hypothetical protein DVA67_032675 [Solirubrobacter sp. CPCC 204708]|uniref:Maleylpyruvate isomerase family mycothiol-dependent enzyme n=1 Tax=Solirubrobacter deserti TaxID=2282478 RepID=A0ABT4RTG2_9ACTN|nr:hypothetical protein [Solirubrobacter deserti]MBE2320760.1 hypothetical protein [Solirubrobacter deserti]MDA0141862.1 hypothetical protein [Solirubrobacter deserti]